MMNSRKALLMILDGWGIGDGSVADVISQVPTPNLTALKNKYPKFQAPCIGRKRGSARRSDGKLRGRPS